MKERIAIIGAGIVGAAIARELTRYQNFEIHIFEKEADVGWGATKANTAIIHGGYDDDPDKYPNRARLCARGNKLWRTLVSELNIPSVWPGALIVALLDEDIPKIETLLERGKRNGVPGLKIIEREDLLRFEPNLNPEAKVALYSPTNGIISPFDAVIALTENAIQNGAKLHLNSKVIDIEEKNGRYHIKTTREKAYFDWIINASGVYGDEISRLVGVDYFTIKPRKGEYYLFDNELGPISRHTLFPTPTPISKGIVVSFTPEGHTLIGPNAHDIEDKEDTSTSLDGLEEVYEGAKRLIPKLPPKRYCISNFAGIRAEPSTGDFIIETYKNVPYFINAVGIRSPGLTSAPAIAEDILKFFVQEDIKLIENPKFNPYREPIKSFHKMSLEEKAEAIAKNPLYGKIVCRCEKVTEAEIVEAIRRGATTLDGIKFRTRAGMGRCQGGFCTPRLMKILERELNLKMTEITKKGDGSYIVCCKTKDLRLSATSVD
ncbi:MAG: FAD/NAD(P)-binding oxidoreductase [Candidatus Asgardarchaeum californiense]|nr:MAG: FAD/NAD(P)-binding oxidoreductase [Candidatus Asgardarchaeum californiense]